MLSISQKDASQRLFHWGFSDVEIAQIIGATKLEIRYYRLSQQLRSVQIQENRINRWIEQLATGTPIAALARCYGIQPRAIKTAIIRERGEDALQKVLKQIERIEEENVKHHCQKLLFNFGVNEFVPPTDELLPNKPTRGRPAGSKSKRPRKVALEENDKKRDEDGQH
jgi:hypothetical protein